MPLKIIEASYVAPIAPGQMSVEDVDPDVIDAIDSAIAKTAPMLADDEDREDVRWSFAFESAKDAATFVAQARVYAASKGWRSRALPVREQDKTRKTISLRPMNTEEQTAYDKYQTLPR
jgi:hypothetical protein